MYEVFYWLLAIPMGFIVAILFSWIGIPLAIQIYGAPAILSAISIPILLGFGIYKRKSKVGKLLILFSVAVLTALSIAGLGNAG